MLITLSLYAMAGFYIYAGISHFRIPKFFLAITPPWVPYPGLVNQIIGLAEIFLGLALLYGPWRQTAAWGIIILLILVFPANVYHFNKARKKNKGVRMTAIRLPLQLVLLYWAFSFT